MDLNTTNIDLYSSVITDVIQTCDKKLEEWNSKKDSYLALRSKLETLPQKLTHDARVPFGDNAFMEGQIVHTNEVLVLLGDNWFVERSAVQAVQIVDRRLKKIDEFIDKVKKERKVHEEKQALVDEWKNAAGVQEIKEDYDPDQESQWRKERRSRVAHERKQERQRALKLPEPALLSGDTPDVIQGSAEKSQGNKGNPLIDVVSSAVVSAEKADKGDNVPEKAPGCRRLDNVRRNKESSDADRGSDEEDVAARKVKQRVAHKPKWYKQSSVGQKPETTVTNPSVATSSTPAVADAGALQVKPGDTADLASNSASNATTDSVGANNASNKSSGKNDVFDSKSKYSEVAVVQPNVGTPVNHEHDSLDLSEQKPSSVSQNEFDALMKRLDELEMQEDEGDDDDDEDDDDDDDGDATDSDGSTCRKSGTSAESEDGLSELALGAGGGDGRGKRVKWAMPKAGHELVEPTIEAVKDVVLPTDDGKTVVTVTGAEGVALARTDIEKQQPRPPVCQRIVNEESEFSAMPKSILKHREAVEMERRVPAASEPVIQDLKRKTIVEMPGTAFPGEIVEKDVVRNPSGAGAGVTQPVVTENKRPVSRFKQARAGK